VLVPYGGDEQVAFTVKQIGQASQHRRAAVGVGVLAHFAQPRHRAGRDPESSRDLARRRSAGTPAAISAADLLPLRRRRATSRSRIRPGLTSADWPGPQGPAPLPAACHADGGCRAASGGRRPRGPRPALPDPIALPSACGLASSPWQEPQDSPPTEQAADHERGSSSNAQVKQERQQGAGPGQRGRHQRGPSRPPRPRATPQGLRTPAPHILHHRTDTPVDRRGTCPDWFCM
jgi:hypothetical protein